MTKDEAIRIAADTVNAMNKAPFNRVDGSAVSELIAVLAALSVLRLDEQPKASGVVEPWEPQRSQVCRLRHPEHGTHAFLWNIKGGIGVWKFIINVLPDYDTMTPAWAWENGWRFVDELRTPAPEPPPVVVRVNINTDFHIGGSKRCEPPADHKAKRWHCLQSDRPLRRPEVHEWDMTNWLCDGEVITPLHMAALGFSYIAPCLIPDTVKPL